MVPRTTKQVAYGILFLIVIGGIITGLVIALSPKPTCSDGKRNQGEEGVDCGGPCKSCKIKNLAIVVKGKQYFSLSKIGKTTFYLQFENPTTDFWVKDFNYALNVYNSIGTKVASFNGSSYLAPGAVRHVVIPATDIDGRDVARIDLGIMDPEWVPTAEYHVDGASILNFAQSVSGGRMQVSGSVTNNVATEAKKIIITAVFRNKDGAVINASATTLDQIDPFSKKSFEIFLTPDDVTQIDISKTEVFLEVSR